MQDQEICLSVCIATFIKFMNLLEAYLGPFQTYLMKIFSENS